MNSPDLILQCQSRRQQQSVVTLCAEDCCETRWIVNIQATRPRPHTAMRDEQCPFVVVSGYAKTSSLWATRKSASKKQWMSTPLGCAINCNEAQRLATARFAPDATRHSPPHELKSRRFAGPIIPNRHPPAWSWGAVPTPFGHSFTRRGSGTLTEFHSCGDKEFARRPAQSVVRTPASTEFGSSARDSACS